MVCVIGNAMAFKPLNFELKPIKEPVKFAFGIHTGIDIGGAVPFPPGEVLGGGNKMNVIPRLSPSIGLSYGLVITKNWTLAIESTYKTVSMDAKTRIGYQYIKEINEVGEVVEQHFEGRADAHMSFTMLEVPLYVKYSFGQGINRIMFGGYYAHVFKAKFDTTPVQGMLGATADRETWKPFGPGEIDTQNFDHALDNWDAGFVIGYERRVIDRVTIGGRFSMGLKDIFRNGEDNKYLSYAMLHMRGTITLSYAFLRR